MIAHDRLVNALNVSNLQSRYLSGVFVIEIKHEPPTELAPTMYVCACAHDHIVRQQTIMRGQHSRKTIQPILLHLALSESHCTQNHSLIFQV